MQIRKTILAVAIAAATHQAYAQEAFPPQSGEVDLSSGHYEQEDVSLGSLNFTGTYSGTEDAIDFEGVDIAARDVNGKMVSITNNANITVTSIEVDGYTNYPTGIDIDGLTHDDSGGNETVSRRSTLAGSVINSGNITVDGAEASGIVIDSTDINGVIHNIGDISARDDRQRDGDDDDLYGARGLDIGAVSAHAIQNDGDIHVLGHDSVGVSLKKTTLGSQQDNIFVNSGSITVTGRNADGVALQDTTIHTFENRGNITAHGLKTEEITDEQLADYDDPAQGIDFDRNATLEKFVNLGTVSATGHDANAIAVDGARFGYGIVNRGEIISDGVGIKVNEVTRTQELENYLQIDHLAGVISGVNAAIDGGDQTDLDWGSAEIHGELRNLDRIQIVGGAKFYGTRIHTKESVLVKDGAYLQLFAAHTTIDGDLTLENGGKLGLKLTDATLENTPILDVTGIATLRNGSEIVLDANVAQFAGKTYELLRAGTLVDEGVQIKSASALLSVTRVPGVNSIGAGLSPVQEPGTPTEPETPPVEPGTPTDPETPPVEPEIPTEPVTPPIQEPAPQPKPGLNVAPNTESANQAVIAQGGGNANAQAAGARFVSVMGSLDARDPVALALISAGNNTAAIARIAAQLAPEVSGGSTQAAMGGQSMISSAIGGRMGAARSGMSSGDGFDEVGGWIQLLSSDANQDMRDGIAGYSADSKGLLFGADGKLNEQSTLGLSYSYINTDVSGDLGSKTDVDTHALTAYGSWTENNLFVDGSVTYGLSKNDAERYIASTKSKANYDSTLFGLNVMAGYTFKLDNGLVVEPRVAGRYSKVVTEKYDEKGSSGSLSIQNEQRMEVAELGAGVRLAGEFNVAGGLLTPEVKAMAFHDFIGDQAKTDAAFLAGGDTFRTLGASSERDSYEFGLGASYRRDQVTFTLGYDRQMKSGFDADTFTAKIRYDF